MEGYWLADYRRRTEVRRIDKGETAPTEEQYRHANDVGNAHSPHFAILVDGRKGYEHYANATAQPLSNSDGNSFFLVRSNRRRDKL